jgi:hypothetical protein
VARSLALLARRFPLIVRGHWLTDHVQKDVAARLAEEAELVTQIGDGRVETRVRPQLVAEGAVLRFQLDHAGGVVRDGL